MRHVCQVQPGLRQKVTVKRLSYLVFLCSLYAAMSAHMTLPGQEVLTGSFLAGGGAFCALRPTERWGEPWKILVHPSAAEIHVNRSHTDTHPRAFVANMTNADVSASPGVSAPYDSSVVGHGLSGIPLTEPTPGLLSRLYQPSPTLRAQHANASVCLPFHRAQSLPPAAVRTKKTI